MFIYACCVFIYSLYCIQNLAKLKVEGTRYFLKPTVFKKLCFMCQQIRISKYIAYLNYK